MFLPQRADWSASLFCGCGQGSGKDLHVYYKQFDRLLLSCKTTSDFAKCWRWRLSKMVKKSNQGVNFFAQWGGITSCYGDVACFLRFVQTKNFPSWIKRVQTIAIALLFGIYRSRRKFKLVFRTVADPIHGIDLLAKERAIAEVCNRCVLRGITISSNFTKRKSFVCGSLCHVALPCIPAVVTFLLAQSSVSCESWGTWLLSLTSSPLYSNVM